MSTSADKKILELADPGYIKKIPSFVRSHPTGNTCRLIEREFPEIYAEFEKEQISAESKDQMRKIGNDIFEERMKKHHML